MMQRIAVNFLAENDQSMIDYEVDDVGVFVCVDGAGAHHYYDHISGYIYYPFLYDSCTH
jgi:hypothetical protein